MQHRLTAQTKGASRQPDLRDQLAVNLQRAFPLNDAGSFAGILRQLDAVPGTGR